MKKIVLPGVGSSTYFTKGMVESLINNGGEFDLCFVDIDEESLDIASNLAKRLVEQNNSPITITSSVNRQEVLPGADIVTSTIGVGGRRAWEKDVLIFREFNISRHSRRRRCITDICNHLRKKDCLLEDVFSFNYHYYNYHY